MTITLSNLGEWRFGAFKPVNSILKEKGIWLAGGALRTLFSEKETIADFDIFFKNKRNLTQAKEDLKALGFKQVFACPKGELFTFTKNHDFDMQNMKLYDTPGLKVQCIAKRFYNDADDLINSFDFTACMAAYDSRTLVLDKRMISSVKTKVLELNHLEYPVASLNRMMKYKEKGYAIPEKTLVSIVQEISGKYFNAKQLALYID